MWPFYHKINIRYLKFDYFGNPACIPNYYENNNFSYCCSFKSMRGFMLMSIMLLIIFP